MASSNEAETREAVFLAITIGGHHTNLTPTLDAYRDAIIAAQDAKYAALVEAAQRLAARVQFTASIVEVEIALAALKETSRDE